MTDYIVATVKPWNAEAFRRRVPALPGRWHLVESPADLTLERLEEIAPRYVFFPHWSWKVPKEICGRFECVCFHMADVPHGRGGSPLQNLILRGHKETKVSALRMVEELDAGPVYLKRPLGLEGRAEDIYRRLAEVVFDMMAEIVVKEPTSVPQEGEAVVFPRRTPEQSRLPAGGGLEGLYDFIRMLDAPTYPAAFIEWGRFRMEFTRASLAGKSVEAKVMITETEEGQT